LKFFWGRFLAARGKKDLVEREREREGQRDRERGKEKERKKEREIDRKDGRERDGNTDRERSASCVDVVFGVLHAADISWDCPVKSGCIRKGSLI